MFSLAFKLINNSPKWKKAASDLPVSVPAVTGQVDKMTVRIKNDHLNPLMVFLDRRSPLKKCFMRRAVILETSPDSITASQQRKDPSCALRKFFCDSGRCWKCDYPQMGRVQRGSRCFSSFFFLSFFFFLQKKKSQSAAQTSCCFPLMLLFWLSAILRPVHQTFSYPKSAQQWVLQTFSATDKIVQTRVYF